MVQADADRILSVLRHAGWLSRVEPGLAEAMVEAGRLVRLPAGAWSHGEGDPETGILVVIEGAIQLFTEAPGDRQVLVCHVEKGGTIGQASRFGGGPRIVTAIGPAACPETSAAGPMPKVKNSAVPMMTRRPEASVVMAASRWSASQWDASS